MENKRFVAFLDILGFSELVKNNSHSYLVNEFKKLLFLNQYYISRGRVYNSATNRYEIFNTDVSKVNLISFSDSIILYTDSNTIDDFKYIIDAISTLLNTGIKNGFPLRGGLVFGEFSSLYYNRDLTYDYINHILLGKALVKAFEIEKKLEWSGCVISDECLKIWKSDTDRKIIEYLKINHRILNYNVPVKTGSKEAYVINWLKNAEMDKNIVEKAFEKHNKSINEKAKIKILNTLKFYDYIFENKYFYDLRIISER